MRNVLIYQYLRFVYFVCFVGALCLGERAIPLSEKWQAESAVFLGVVLEGGGDDGVGVFAAVDFFDVDV